MSAYRAQVADALAAVRVRGSTSYAWMGRTCRALPATLTAEMDDAERRDFLVSCLREELYASFYCHARAVPARWGEPQPSATDRRLAAALSAANCGRGAWQDGWTVERVDGNEASVARPGLRVRAPLSQCRGTGNGVVVGAAIALRVPKDLPARSPGFFSVVGDVAEDDPFEAVVRVYWNIGPAAAPELVRLLSAALNARGVPFRLKVADHPMRFDRCDAAVLYLPASRFAGVRDQLAAIASTLARASARASQRSPSGSPRVSDSPRRPAAR